MAYKIITTPYSERDLDAILRYMVEELHAPLAAADFAEQWTPVMSGSQRCLRSTNFAATPGLPLRAFAGP